MKRRVKAKRAASKPALPIRLTVSDAYTLQVIDRRLLRCCDLLSCLEFCQAGELNLSAIAIATRDLIDTVRTDLKPVRRIVEKAVQS